MMTQRGILLVGKKILAVVSFLILGTLGANAANNYTVANTTINNSATLNYTVGTVAQTAIVSNTDTFVVDKKIDVLVAEQDASKKVDVTPGSTKQVLKYIVTNNGNSTQDFLLTDTITDTNSILNGAPVIYADTNNNGVYDDGTDQVATYIDELAPDAQKTIFIVSNIKSTALDTQSANVNLIAQVAEGGTSGTAGAAITSDDSGTADAASTVQNVFADGAGTADSAKDGKHSDVGTYHVVTATIAVVKSSCVVNDPVNGTTNPKRIPGATIRYAIDVKNSGSADATSVSVTDILDNALTYVSGAIKTTTNVNTACDCATASGTTGTDTVSASGQTVTANYGTVSSNSRECAYIETTIK